VLDGHVVGAIGASGSPLDQDREVAAAGVAALAQGRVTSQRGVSGNETKRVWV
jgi:hypothetical protein